jgi:hypothetical protein
MRGHGLDGSGSKYGQVDTCEWVMNLRVPWNAGNFLISWEPVSLWRRTLLHGVSKYIYILKLVCVLTSNTRNFMKFFSECYMFRCYSLSSSTKLHYLKHKYVFIEMFRNLQVSQIFTDSYQIELHISKGSRVNLLFVKIVLMWFLKLLKLCWFFLI